MLAKIFLDVGTGYLGEVCLVKELGVIASTNFARSIVSHEQSDFKFLKSESNDLGCCSKGRVGLTDRGLMGVYWLGNNQ